VAPPSKRNNPGFSRRAHYGLFFGYVLTVGGAVMAAIVLLVGVVRPEAFAIARAAVREVTTPVATGMAAIGSGIVHLPETVASYFGVRGENIRLKEQIAQERDAVRKAITLANENRRLKALLRVREMPTQVVATARLVSSSPSAVRRYAVLNAGFLQGVRPSQAVRAPDGLVGRVVEVGPDTARILLIGDPESIVPVRRTRDGLAAIAMGRGDRLIELRSVNSADLAIHPGDIFVTSGTGGIYAPGIPVARVVARNRDVALAEPFAEPAAFDYATVERQFMAMPAPREAEH